MGSEFIGLLKVRVPSGGSQGLLGRMGAEINLEQLLGMCGVASLGQASRFDSQSERPGLGQGRDTEKSSTCLM